MRNRKEKRVSTRLADTLLITQYPVYPRYGLQDSYFVFVSINQLTWFAPKSKRACLMPELQLVLFQIGIPPYCPTTLVASNRTGRWAPVCRCHPSIPHNWLYLFKGGSVCPLLTLNGVFLADHGQLEAIPFFRSVGQTSDTIHFVPCSPLVFPTPRSLFSHGKTTSRKCFFPI